MCPNNLPFPPPPLPPFLPQPFPQALSFIHTMKLYYTRAHAQYGAILSQQQQQHARSQEEEEEGKEGGGTAAVAATTTAAAAAAAAAAAERKKSGKEETAASFTDAWSFAGGWAMMELLRIKASPVPPSLPPSLPPFFFPLLFSCFRTLPSTPPPLLSSVLLPRLAVRWCRKTSLDSSSPPFFFALPSLLPSLPRMRR